ncbi:MAG: NINE protein [Saprospiraceae bacterium]|nr:NINE protein [Candidatus Opimibacter iunctus]
MEQKFKRQLAAIVFTDIVGYTHLMHINENHALLLRSRHRSILLALHEKYGGEVLQFFGDGTLSIFHSSVNAVECAVEMQIEFKKDPEVPVRIGIHVGDISYDGTDAFGDGLNVAARIEPICEPGGVFISERVFEDIRNHSWLQAVHVGNYQLKNIAGDTPLFGISSKDMALPVVRNPRIPPSQHVRPQPNQPANAFQSPYEHEGKSKSVAALLSILLGLWGVQRFYLGKRIQGILNFGAFFLSLALVIEERFPWFLVALAILSVIEGVLFFVMPQGEFDAKYNSGRTTTVKEKKAMKAEEKKRNAEPAQARKSRGNLIIKDAFIAYKAGNYEMARKYFEDALQYDYNDPRTHFMLACCHSIGHDAKQAYFHLASAVDFGFQEFEEIYHNEALTWLRALPDFDAFVANGYRQVAYLNTPKPDLLESKSYYDATVLDRIADLGELLERGVISREDFESQKKGLLGHG